jgi:hypothetical protein
MERTSLHLSQLLASPSGGKLLASLTPSAPTRHSRRRSDIRKCNALPELAHLDLDAIATSVSHAIFLGYEPLVLPCSSMNCGDMVYRR